MKRPFLPPERDEPTAPLLAQRLKAAMERAKARRERTPEEQDC